MAPPAAPPRTSAARRDLLALATLGLLTFAAARRFDLFDRLVEAGRRLEGAGGDALIVTALALAFGLTAYAWRRWRETRRALSDRARSQEALCASEARLRLLTRQLPAFLWTTDLELRLDSFAGGGFRRDDIDPRGRVGQTVAEFFGTADPAFPPLAAHRRALGGDPAAYPLRRDGRAYEVRVEPLRDAAGAIVGTLGLGVDVTERAQATAALRDSEARFRAIFEHAAIGIGLADLERRPLMVNPALARFTGRDGGEAGEGPFPRSTHPEDAARDGALYAELVAGARDHYQLEKRYVRADGRLAWGRLTTSLVRDAAGVPRYAIGMVEDITGRMLAEAALREREARYRAVVEQVAEGIFLFDAATKRIAEANPAFCRLLGYTAEELAALTLYDLVAHDRASVDANIGRIAAARHHPIGARRYRRKDGTTVPVEISATTLSAGDNDLFCVVVRDMTARREGERALRASEAQLQAVVQNAPVLLFTLDGAGVTTFAAGRGLAALGHTPEGVVGWSPFADAPHDPAVPGYVRRALAGEPVEARVAAGDRVFATHYAPLRDEAGAVTGVIGVATDITAQRRAEAERDAIRRRLSAVREEERLALAREIHDEAIQGILGIRLALQLGRRALGPEPADAGIAALLDDGAHAAREVIGRLRRIVSGLRPAGLEELGLVAALEGYAAHVRRREAGTGLIVGLDLDPTGATLPSALMRALFRVAQEGIRNVRRHAGARRVTIALRIGTREATMHVADDGGGFAPPPDLSTLGRAGHFGLLGLAEQLSDLGGTLTVESRPGAGTTITARVPVVLEERGDG